jgi:hypothetical protein
MFKNSIAKLRSTLARAHNDEGGAMALACLAACLILFMIVLVLYDTGKATRDKIKNQTASDAATYSQAAIKARTMNMVMYTNISKRHIAAAQLAYFSAYAAYAAWIAQRCSKCNWYRPQACWDCTANGALLASETGIPFLLESDTAKLWTRGKYANVLGEIDKYQKYMITITPWWAYMEGMTTGTRNGASVVTSFPPLPDKALTGIPDLVGQALTIIRGSGLYTQTYRKDQMPLKKQSDGCFNLDFMIDITYLGILAKDPLAVPELEWYMSRQKSQSSSKVPLTSKGPKDFASSYRNPAWNVAGCLLTALGSGVAGAHKPNVKDAWDNSNMTFSYMNDKAINQASRNKYKFIGKDYDTTLTAYEKPNGYWSLARAEFFTKGNPSPWYPNWTARMRPLDSLTYSVNAMYHDVVPFFAIQGVFSLLVGLDMSSFIKDLVYFEKVSRMMDPGTSNGLYR